LFEFDDINVGSRIPINQANTTKMASIRSSQKITTPTIYIMSRYHASTHLTDRNLTPKGVLKLSSGDCRHLMNIQASKTKQQLLTSIDAAPYCKVTWGTTISRRLEHISEILNIHPQLMTTPSHTKMYAATPYEEAYATAISNKVYPDVQNAKILLAFGGSCLHVLSVNQDKDNNLLPGSNSVSEGLSKDIQDKLVSINELVGTEENWIDNYIPPLPPKGTFYTTFPLDSDLDYSTFILIARLFQELNELVTNANGSYLICGAPTLINPTNDNKGVGKWWPDKSPRVIQTSFHELAMHSALPQKQDDESGIFHGGLLSDRYRIQVGRSSSSSLIETTVHEMVLSAMAQPQLVIDKSIALSDSTIDRLRGIDLAMQYFSVHDK